VGRVFGNDDFQWPIGRHPHRHAGGDAQIVRTETAAAGGLIGQARLENLLIFGRQWGLLREAGPLGGVE
jgi:hypothetical protein